MVTLKASGLGISKIKQARKAKGWTIDDYRWLEVASQFLGVSWEERGCFADGISEGTWKRFLSGKYAINANSFKAFCRALDLPWQDVIEGKSQQDWGEAIDVTQFFGREAEIATLKNWILTDKCRLISLLGIGGIGKTSLSIKVSQLVQDNFEFVIWRSLRNTPRPEKILVELIQFVSNQKETNLSAKIEDKILLLLQYLRSHRCLLILDNVESILQPSQGYLRTSPSILNNYLENYQGYGELFKTISETEHQSCLLITSREKIPGLATWEGDNLPVRCLQLQGLSEAAGKAIFATKGDFIALENQWQKLSDRYGGNPLALKITASAIKDFFAGDVVSFLEVVSETSFILDDIYSLLSQQFQRLSYVEKYIMYWLAIAREPLSLLELKNNFSAGILLPEIIQGLTSLQSRSLIEKQDSFFSQQTVIMEFMINNLIKKVTQEIKNKNLDLFNKVALIQAQTKDYIREAQIKAIANPIINYLSNSFNTQQNLENHLKEILQLAQEELRLSKGYVAGNIINLLAQLNTDFTDYNFANLTIKEANLQGINLHNVNFTNADLSQSVFTQSLGNILAAVFSSDGKRLATCDTDCQIRLWLVKTGKLLAICSGHHNWVRAVAFNHDNKILASGSADGTVKLWDTQDGTCIKTLIGHNHEVFSIAFTAEDDYVVSSSGDTTVKLWHIETGECLHTFRGHKNWVRTVASHPKKNIIASGSDDGTIRLWDIETGKCWQVLTGHKSWVRTITFSPDGIVLVSGSGDNTVKLWDIYSGECLRTLTRHDQSIYAVAIGNDGKLIASGSGDNTVRIWDSSTGKCLRTLHGHTNQIVSVAFNPSNNTLVCVSLDQTVKIWDIKTGNCWKTWYGHTDWAMPIAYSPDGKTIASGNNDSSIKLWNYPQGNNFGNLEGHQDLVYSLAFHPHGKILASGSTDGTVRLWDYETGKCQQILSGHKDWIFAVAFSPDGTTLVSGSADQTVKLWDYQTGRCLHTFVGHQDKIFGVACSPNSQLIASASTDGTVKLWDINSDKCLNTLTGHSNRVYSVAFSPDARTIVSGSTDGTVRLWDINSGQCLNTLTGHSNWVFSVTISPDGQTIASASHDQTARIWDIKTGKCLHICEGHTHLISSVTFSPDGKTIISGSQDQTVRIWDTKTGECVQILRSARIYENMNITGATGLTEAQKMTLKALGAVEK